MLYKDGWKEKDIAKTLSIGQREVHLVLQMQEK
jgi:DNA-binding transcriptional regulator LsrR (DeoR family)